MRLSTALWCLIASIALIARSSLANDKPEVANEYLVKAVYLLNFTKFIEWPENAFANASAPFVFGIVGEDPFGPILEGVLAHQTVAGRPIVVRRVGSDSAATDCHVIFFSKSTKEQQSALLERTANQPVLTVGESDQFLQAGGIINFVLIKDRVRFETNARVADRTGLKLGAKLLGVSVRVITSKGDK